ncbi:hypothetical protein [Xanthocytophaga agilis]|uniref:Uncharacterized protein n=1 Tax=Xanthocytophaga agilis TaxID=3048010 RepID=A0AAE3UIS6_9BACT|nr:hypothetical protein [Xanthocytophaga agilis]MDJ1504812.1 hypothetical protein [Xanthocytophaga agilis]
MSSDYNIQIGAVGGFFRTLWAIICRRKVSMPFVRRALSSRGYAIREPYVLYKDCRVAKIQVDKKERIWLFTHSRHKPYVNRYRVWDMVVVLYRVRQSYLNFLYAASRPGVSIPRIEINLQTNRQRGTVSGR